MRTEKANVRNFYESFGWQRNADGQFGDTKAFVDTRSVLDIYNRETRLRVKQFLKGRGTYFLDAGCGAVPHPEYLEYSTGYQRRVCVDLSFTALTEARAKVGPVGLFVQADLTQLPFRDGVCDAVVSAHVVYHIPADEQETAIREYYRTLAPGGDCVIVYARESSPLTALGRSVPRLRHFVKRLVRRGWRTPAAVSVAASSDATTAPEPLYIHRHEYTWFERTLPREWNVDVRSAKSVDREFSTYLVPDNIVGRVVLRTLRWLEDALPHAMVRIGRYPLVVINKPR